MKRARIVLAGWVGRAGVVVVGVGVGVGFSVGPFWIGAGRSLGGGRGGGGGGRGGGGGGEVLALMLAVVAGVVVVVGWAALAGVWLLVAGVLALWGVVVWLAEWLWRLGSRQHALGAAVGSVPKPVRFRGLRWLWASGFTGLVLFWRGGWRRARAEDAVRAAAWGAGGWRVWRLHVWSEGLAVWAVVLGVVGLVWCWFWVLGSWMVMRRHWRSDEDADKIRGALSAADLADVGPSGMYVVSERVPWGLGVGEGWWSGGVWVLALGAVCAVAAGVCRGARGFVGGERLVRFGWEEGGLDVVGRVVAVVAVLVVLGGLTWFGIVMHNSGVRSEVWEHSGRGSGAVSRVECWGVVAGGGGGRVDRVFLWERCASVEAAVERAGGGFEGRKAATWEGSGVL